MSAQPQFSHFGRYRVVGELGRGAMGVVYEAEDETLQRHVAVKTMLLSDDAEERAEHEARFRQEAKAAAGLNHPNVITIYDMGREGDWLYIAMEVLRGQELRELMNSGNLPLPVAVDLISQVASGLGAAHMRGIVHRDIKPSNIMVMNGRHAKIMDFGVARMQISEVKTQTGVMLGSPKYMAPEQVEGRGVDSRSDIFSLGSVLYECVSGAPPFTGNDLGTLLYNIVNREAVPPSQRNPAVPQELDRIIARALRKDPGARYQDADMLAHELAQCAAQLMAGAVRPGTFSPAATISGFMPFLDSTTSPGRVAAPPPADDPERTVAQVRKRPSGAQEAYDATLVNAAAMPADAPAEPDSTRDSEPPAGDATLGRTTTEKGVRRASFRVAPEFDSIAALQRLATGAGPASPPPPPALPVEIVPEGPPPWAWPTAYGVAALAALWIAFG